MFYCMILAYCQWIRFFSGHVCALGEVQYRVRNLEVCQAVFEIRCYLQREDHQYEIKKILKLESEHEVFNNHIATVNPRKNIHFYVKV